MSSLPAALFGRGIAFPPRITSDGKVAWSEGEMNVRESIRIILLTDERERIRLPEFGGGLSRFLFEPNTATTRQLILSRVERALSEWEPRIHVASVTVDPDPDDREAAIVTITYRLVATGALERTSVSVSLAGS
jgi:phage baseplate assembly protein W